MKNLMRGRPFEKISVSDICVECGINRKSFYYHFRGRYFYREKDFYRVALKIEGQNSFRDYFMEITAPVASLFLQDVLPSKEEESFFVTFVLDAFLAALVRWLSGGYDHEMDADEFTSRMKEILHRVGDTIPE